MSTLFKVRGRSERGSRSRDSALLWFDPCTPRQSSLRPGASRCCVRALFRLRRFLSTREAHVKASFVRGIYSSLKDYSFFLKGQKTECDDCHLFCGRIKTLSSLSHDARKTTSCSRCPQPFCFNRPLQVLTFRRVTVGFVRVPNISLGCVSVNSCLQIQTSHDFFSFFFLPKSLVARDLRQERHSFLKTEAFSTRQWVFHPHKNRFYVKMDIQGRLLDYLCDFIS